ncbi:MAG TPA: c-type cytochrome [Vicinamibacterales bacterium]|nr:c-type cytochrome [Vicinamibacterales bacterium]
MRTFAFALLLASTAAAAGAQPKRSPAMTGGSAETAAGKRVFDAQCAWCHGNDGDGGTGPNLHGRLAHATDLKSIVDIVANGIAGSEMPSFRSPLTEHAIRQAAAYVQSLSRSAKPAAAGNVPHGKTVYDANGCASCHTVDGRGGILGPELTNIGGRRGAPYLREALVKPEAAHPPGYLVVRAVTNGGTEVRGIRVAEDVFWVHVRDARGVHTLQKSELTSLERQPDASLMPSYANRLAAADLDDLVAYLSTLRSTK